MLKPLDASQPRKRIPPKIFGGLFIANMAAMLGLGILLPLLSPYAKELGASEFLVGLVFAGYAIGRGICSPIFGQVSDKYGRKNMMLLGLFLYGTLPLGYILSDSILLLPILWFFQGVASAMVSPIAQSYIGDITPPGKEGRVMNLFYLGQFGGVAIGPFIGGYLSDRFSFDAPFYFMIGAAFLGFFLVLFGIPDIKKAKDKVEQSFRKSVKTVLQDVKMKGVLSYLVGRGFYRWGFNSFFPIYVITLAGLSKSQVGILVSGYMVAGTALQYPCGRLADRFYHNRAELLGVGGAISAVCMFLVPLLTSMFWLVALVILMGAVSAMPRATTVAIRTERGRKLGMGAVTGVYMTGISLGQVLGPVGFGAISDLFTIPIAFYIGGITGLATTGLAYWYLRFKPSSSEKETSTYEG